MRKEYDFSLAKPVSEVPELARHQAATRTGKARVTMYLDEDVLALFRERAQSEGRGYQTMINEALRQALGDESEALTLSALRRVLREELHTRSG